MVKYSFNADLRCVFQRLAAARPGAPAPAANTESPANAPKVIPFRAGTLQPRLEIARVALRRDHDDQCEAVT
jgi:hypothetical protein